MYIPYGETSSYVSFFLWLFIPYGESPDCIVFFLWFFILYGEIFYPSFFPEGIYSITFLLLWLSIPYGESPDCIAFFLWFFIPYGESSTYLFSRREFISIEKHYKKMLFPRRGYILSPFFLWLFIPYGEIFYPSFFPEGIYIHRKTL